VDGYETSENYLVTRHPTQQTVTEFWKIIVTEQVTHILFLKKLNVSFEAKYRVFIYIYRQSWR
jgi:protein tyrosine phosphatase